MTASPAATTSTVTPMTANRCRLRKVSTGAIIGKVNVFGSDGAATARTSAGSNVKLDR